MIKAVFKKNRRSALIGFELSGHAGSAGYGKDIVCAAVSAMTMLTVNTLEEVFKAGGAVKAENEGYLSYLLPADTDDKISDGVLRGFFLELCELEKRYPKSVSVRTADTEQKSIGKEETSC